MAQDSFGHAARPPQPEGDDQSQDQASLAEQNTRSMSAVQRIPPGSPRHSLRRSRLRSYTPPQQSEVPDQETMQVPAVPAAQSTPLADPVSMVDLETVQIPAVPVSPSTRLADPVVDLETAHIPAVLAPPSTPFVDPVVDLETAQIAAIPVAEDAGSAAEPGEQAGIIKRLLRAGLMRLQEPQPEGPLTRGVQVVRLEIKLGLAPLLAVTNALGLLLTAGAYYVAIANYPYALREASFFAGLLTIIVPNFLRLLSRTPTRPERICLLTMLALACYLSQFMNNPHHFLSFDEFLHWRTADDILRTGHLFSFNSMLPVSSYYPGLELITDAISSTTGLNTFYAGNIVIAVSRIIMVLALYLFYECLTDSSRMASIGLAIYIANPHFIFFDNIYNYETVALPMATVMAYILVRYKGTDKNQRWVKAAAWIMFTAIIITHHMTSYFFDGLLILWAIVSFWRPTQRGTRIHITALAAYGLILALAYAFLFPGNPVWSYLSQYFGGAFTQLQMILTGSVHSRPLFTNSLQATPIWDRILMTGSVALITFTIPFGMLSVQRLFRNNALAVTLAIAAISYPLTQAFRFTSFGAEITDRAAAFLFLPIAYVLTVLITHFWPTRKLTRRTLSLLAGALVILFMGSTVVGAGQEFIALPGPYLVSADGRSIEPEGIDAALWSISYLGPDNRLAADRTNQMLMSTYGHQRVLTRLGDGVDVAPLFYSTQFDSADITLLQLAQIHYLVVDTRISTALPVVGVYFENDLPTQVISKDGLTKFNAVAQINRLFDSGDIVIYDTEAFTNASGP